MHQIVIKLLALLLVANFACESRAQEEYIEVVGTANLKSPADLVEIRAMISGAGETAKIAIKDFEEKKEDFEGSLSVMNFPDAELTFEGPQITNGQMNGVMQMQQMFNDGGVEQAEKFGCQESVLIQIPVDSSKPMVTVKKIAKVIDACASASATLGGNMMEYAYTGEAPEGMTRMRRSDVKGLQKKVTKMAFEDAKRQAAELSGLAGMELGSVISIRTSTESEVYFPGMENLDESGVDISKSLVVRFRVK